MQIFKLVEGYRQIPLGFNNLLKLKWFVYCRKCFLFEVYFALCDAAVLIENVMHADRITDFLLSSFLCSVGWVYVVQRGVDENLFKEYFK